MAASTTTGHSANASCSVVPEFACDGNFTAGQVCGANSSTCVEPRQGCCDSGIVDCAGAECLGFGMCHDNISELECRGQKGNFVEDAVCDISRRRGHAATMIPGRCIPIDATPTGDSPHSRHTPTPTATETKIPEGGSCVVRRSTCDSGNCVEDVCCESACDEPGESCAVPGFEGTCLPPPTMAPVASSRGLVMLVLGLAGGRSVHGGSTPRPGYCRAWVLCRCRTRWDRNDEIGSRRRRALSS